MTVERKPMNIRAQNLLVIMSDEHNPDFMGCAGHSFVKTPNLDALAARGTRFDAAYTNCPICVPSRASFATGRYTHQLGYWDNSIAYDGRIEGWGHRLQDAGMRVESIGKLHYRNGADLTGFDKQHIPMHIKDGVGMVQGSVRGQFPDFRRPPPRPGAGQIAPGAGPGETSYTRYDRKIAEIACDWIANAGNTRNDKPWVLFVSFVSPCPGVALASSRATIRLSVSSMVGTVDAPTFRIGCDARCRAPRACLLRGPMYVRRCPDRRCFARVG
jgi:choline-sulfatase